MTNQFPVLYAIWVIRKNQPFFIHADATYANAVEYGDRNISGRNYVIQAYHATEEVAPKDGQLTNENNLKIPDKVLSDLQIEPGDSVKFSLNSQGRWEIFSPKKEIENNVSPTVTDDSSSSYPSASPSWEISPDGFLKTEPGL